MKVIPVCHNHNPSTNAHYKSNHCDKKNKTYTLVGQESDPGLLPRLLEALFQQEAVLSGQLVVTASFYEIKDEQVRDILKQDFYTPGGLKVCWPRVSLPS